MLRTKDLTLLTQTLILMLLCLTLSGCKQTKKTSDQPVEHSTLGKELLLQVQENSTNQTVESTTEVFRGDFVKSMKAKAELYFTKNYQVTYETKSIKTIFEEYLVAENQYVNVGDAIARIRYEADPVRLEELKIELKQLEEKAEVDLYDTKKQIRDLENQIMQSTKLIEKTKLETALANVKNEYASYETEVAKRKQTIKDEMEDYDFNGTTDYIYAPCSGITARPERIEIESLLWHGQPILAIYEPSSAILVFEDMTSQMRYGMEVSIEVTNQKATKTLQGKVVSGDNLIDEDRRIGYVCVRVDDFDSSRYLDAKFKVIAMLTDLKDVLLVDESAVSIDHSNTYITCLEDGKKKKVYFISGGMNDTYYWVLEGLEEGMVALK